MSENQNSKRYDLEERTFQFSKSVALYIKQLPKTISNLEYSRQVVDSSGSVGANYIEANEALSKKDFMMRVKICRKEAKESAYWLRLIVETNDEKWKQEGKNLLNEALELKRYFLQFLQSQNSFRHLNIDIWNLFGACNLGFGI
jgi:four helix bundle protein